VADKKKTGGGAKPKKRKPGAADAESAPKHETAAEEPTVVTVATPATAAPGAAAASPLEGRPGSGAEGAVMVEHPHLGKITLRGDAADQALVDAVKGAVGVAPPLEPNSVATAGHVTIHWLGPDEWLIVTPAGEQGAVETALDEALEGRHVSIVDTTDARTTIRLHGVHARDVLMKGCPLDLHPRAFGPGRCAQTIIAKADVLIHQRDDAPTYDIYVLCSFACYLWDWLVDATKEFS
jgi:sarcosine oxidase subunit gamma